jgi:hypothetical protein
MNATAASASSPTKSLARGTFDEQGKISCSLYLDVHVVAAETKANALHLPLQQQQQQQQQQQRSDLENPNDHTDIVAANTLVAPKRKVVQFAEEEDPMDGGCSAWRSPPRTPKPKVDGREWRKRQQIKRRVERRRDNYHSEPLLKRIAKLSRAMLACIPYYVDDVTNVEDPTAIGSLRSIMSIQLALSLMLLALAILDLTRSPTLRTAVSPSGGNVHAIDPLFVTISLVIVGATYILARKWDKVPPSKVARGLIFMSHLLLAANYALAFVAARFCPRRDPFGYSSGCRQEGVGASEDFFVNNGDSDAMRRRYSMEDCILYGATSLCWLLLSCPVYVCISRVRATVLGKLDRLTKMEKASRAAQKQMRRFSV